jgi:hypothetical protein
VVLEAAVAGGTSTLPPIVAGPGQPEIELSTLVREVARAGEIDRAESLARSITSPRQRDETLDVVAEATAVAGDIDRAVAIGGQIATGFIRGRTLNAVAKAAAGRVLDWAAVAASVDSRHWQAQILSTVAFAAVEAGDLDRAAIFADQAEKVARADYVWATESFAVLATVVATAGDADRARALADQVDADVVRMASPADQLDALGTAVAMAASIGDRDRSDWLLTRMLIAASQLTQPEQATEQVITAMVAAGKMRQAEALARTLAAPANVAINLTAVAFAAAKAGETDLPTRLIGDAVDLADSVWEPIAREDVLVHIVAAVAALGDVDRAEEVAGTIGDPIKHAVAHANLVQHLAVSGEIERADAILAQIITDDPRVWEIVPLSRAVAALAAAVKGDRAAALIERAEELARSIMVPNGRAEALCEVALVAPDRARRLVAEAFQIAQNWTIPLPALAKVDPAVVIEIADELLASRAAGGQ